MLIVSAKKTIQNAEADDYRRIDRKAYKLAAQHPMFRRRIREVSVDEDDDNSYYSGMLDTLAEHCVGSVPIIQGNLQSPEANNKIEDRWLEWAISNKVGSTIRQIRRAAARTGIGIAIPYQTSRTPENPIGFNLRTVSALRLCSPAITTPDRNIVDGIEYDKNGDIINIFIAEDGRSDPKEYSINEVILWFKETEEDMPIGMPECGPAFCLFPSVKRLIKAMVVSEEFRASIPMVVTMDPEVYKPSDTDGTKDKYKHEPGFVPTLPPGTDLKGVDLGTGSVNSDRFLYMLISAAARCIQMPRNLAIGDSGNSNMATAAYDIQPWKNKIKIDRTDFQPVVRKIIRMWMDRAVLVSNYLPVQSRGEFTYDLNYDVTFEHPDPLKRANARAVDLASGATTLDEVYNDKGKNARRALDREAATLGKSREELNEIIIASRVNAPFLIEEKEPDDNNKQSKD